MCIGLIRLQRNKVIWLKGIGMRRNIIFNIRNVAFLRKKGADASFS
jgi:hypothetical protein